MDSTGLKFVTKNFTTITSVELVELMEISKRYPYCQLLHVLQARASKDLQAKDHIDLLHRSAVYATDRAVIKWAVSVPPTARLAPPPSPPVAEGVVARQEVIQVIPKIAQPTRQLVPKKDPDPVPQQSHIENSLEGDELRNDLESELQKLQKLKQSFEASYQELKKNLHDGALEKKINSPVTDALPAKETSILDEIKSTRKKLKVASSKALEQNEIIDQFIKAAPALPKAKPDMPKTDLAENSSNFSDQIVSETLVTILIKQGKKVKAIEMLKKLIWKFPQKKAYFAAQIEELKN